MAVTSLPSVVSITNVQSFFIDFTSLLSKISPPFFTPFSTKAKVYSNGPTIPPVGANNAPFMFLFKLGSIFKTSSLLRIFNPLTPFSLPFIYKLFIFFISSSSKANTKDPFLLKGTDSSLHNSSNISLPFTLYLAINVPTFGSYPA